MGHEVERIFTSGAALYERTGVSRRDFGKEGLEVMIVKRRIELINTDRL